MDFPHFTSLPLELQMQVWEAITAGPSMHIFDVCFPTVHGASRAEKAFGPLESMDQTTRERWKRYEKTVFVDCLDTSDEEVNRETHIARYPFDPSRYHLTRALTSVSKTTAAMVRRTVKSDATNTVYLPGRASRVTYPDSDVLMLRFRDGGAATQAAANLFPVIDSEVFRFSSISEVLESQWSDEMAETLHGAKKIAFDVSEAWMPDLGGEMAFEEVMYLACTLHKDLEVLYLVDNCAGRCKGCKRNHLKTRNLGNRGELFNGLHYQDGGDKERQPDVISAVSKRYVEAFDLEKLGWDDEHPAYVFARMIDEAIRSQQQGTDSETFQGVRVLVVEDEELQGRESDLLVDCKAAAKAEFAVEMLDEMSMYLLPALAGQGLMNADTKIVEQTQVDVA